MQLLPMIIHKSDLIQHKTGNGPRLPSGPVRSNLLPVTYISLNNDASGFASNSAPSLKILSGILSNPSQFLIFRFFNIWRKIMYVIKNSSSASKILLGGWEMKLIKETA